MDSITDLNEVEFLRSWCFHFSCSKKKKDPILFIPESWVPFLVSLKLMPGIPNHSTTEYSSSQLPDITKKKEKGKKSSTIIKLQRNATLQ